MHRLFAVPAGSPAPPLLYEARGWLPRVSGLPLALLAIAAGVGLLAISARLRITLGFSPVPITGQSFAVLLIGAVYGSRLGAATVLAYLATATAGLPFFAGGASGWAYFTGTSGGYFVGFFIAAYAVGWLAERGWDRTALTMAAAMVIGNVIIYVPGWWWLMRELGISAGRSWDLGVQPFLIGDALKIGLASGLLPAAWAIRDELRKRSGPR
ncbi:MAG: biotin transporter BioY [Chloroflexi bacterium]|nr:biotin transporter BioY [Chloroflexota bacterium]MQC19339.1 biotin transporter BioY [Chloroflexota bacterium]